jgi:hypothetical protein
MRVNHKNGIVSEEANLLLNFIGAALSNKHNNNFNIAKIRMCFSFYIYMKFI